ncbi:transcriptional regulator [Streptomyces tateyamensis]|uniref:Transcriptional regulator n=1 Tax=Streptomyces tateyamensis TaxID=565073 RepID=A0A2V4PBH8_9ACTN|nr:helix-turn-helix transcriptional regulator [Streptomyces tateyamensis]PYC88418.1 transcriptional regulator [Streptomyces tateyamensis]
MPRSQRDEAPVLYLLHGVWPEGRLRDDAPASARYGQIFAQRLKRVIAERGLNPLKIEKTIGVNRRTVERTLRGAVLPDFGAIARLEDGLQVGLWPCRHCGPADHTEAN